MSFPSHPDLCLYGKTSTCAANHANMSLDMSSLGSTNATLDAPIPATMSTATPATDR